MKNQLNDLVSNFNLWFFPLTNVYSIISSRESEKRNVCMYPWCTGIYNDRILLITLVI